MNRWTILLTLLLSWMLGLWAGCAQQTTGVTDQPAVQTQAPRTDQLAGVSQSDVSIYAGIFGEGIPSGTASTLLDGGRPDLVDASGGGAGSDGATIASAKTGNLAITYINVQTGGTSTAEQASGATHGTIQPGATLTQTPTQEPQANIPISLALPIGPGSYAAPSAAGTFGPGTTTLTPEHNAQLTTLLHQAARGDAGAYERFLELARSLGVVPPASPAER